MEKCTPDLKRSKFIIIISDHNIQAIKYNQKVYNMSQTQFGSHNYLGEYKYVYVNMAKKF